MFQENLTSGASADVSNARDWVRVLARYREPSTWRSSLELAITLGPFILLWALAWWALSISGWLTLGISLVNAGFLLRLKMVTHQRDRARAAQKVAETQRDQGKDQSKLDRDIRDKRAVKRRQTIKEVEQGEVPSTLSDDLNTW